MQKGFSEYGAAALRGKVAAVLLFLATPGWAGAVTVLALGDSLTQGYGLVESEGFVPQMQAWLRERDVDARLINGGVSGDTTAGGAARVAWSLTEEVDAMIVALGGNDLLRGIEPAVSRGNLEKILKEAAARDVAVLLVGMRAPGNYGPEYKAEFDAIYPDLAEAHDTLLFGSFFKGLGVSDPAKAQRFFQPDGTHPNAEGVARIVAAMGPAVRRLIARAKSDR